MIKDGATSPVGPTDAQEACRVDRRLALYSLITLAAALVAMAVDGPLGLLAVLAALVAGTAGFVRQSRGREVHHR